MRNADRGFAGRVIVIGGGLAGLAATQALAKRGFEVTLLESRNRLGGRAGSFTDAASGQLVDTCQHASMGCCTEFARFCRTVGINHLLAVQPTLYFMTPDRRISRFQADRYPVPFHLARAFLTSHFLTPSEKLRIAWGLSRLVRTDPDADPPFTEWLARHRQTPRTVERFWGLVLTSALNESPDRIGLKYARKVFVDGFFRDRRGFEVELPRVPLGKLYGDELLAWLNKHSVRLELNAAVGRLEVEGNRVRRLQLRQGETREADWYVSAVPFDRLLDLLPPDVIEGHSYFNSLRQLETSPITSVHLWYDRNITQLPHVVLVDCVGQWVFNRGEVSENEPRPPGGGLSRSLPGGRGSSSAFYVQVVVSAARQFRGLGRDEVQRRIAAEMGTLFPDAKPEALLRARVVTEHAATFSAVPGVDRWRPKQVSPIENLLVAGDWTATGWPATMEGAVRSGYLAAEAVRSNK